MGNVTRSELITAIKDTLAVAEDIQVAFGHTELPESITDPATMMVYWTDDEWTSISGTSDRLTFGGGKGDNTPVPTRETVQNFHVDIFAVQRSFLGENMEDVINLTDQVDEILCGIISPPYFGHAAIKSFRWRAQRWDENYDNHLYMGSRFRIEVEVF